MNNFIVSNYVILLSGSPSAWVAHSFQLKAPKHISGLFTSTFVLCILKKDNSIHPFLPQATLHFFKCNNSNMFNRTYCMSLCHRSKFLLHSESVAVFA